MALGISTACLYPMAMEDSLQTLIDSGFREFEIFINTYSEMEPEFLTMLEEKTGLPVAFVDERGTTVTAHGYLNQTDVRGKKRKAVVDSVAAVIILQNYLDYRRNYL